MVHTSGLERVPGGAPLCARPEMGLHAPITKEPDWRNVARKAGKAEKPCVLELSALMDCMKVR